MKKERIDICLSRLARAWKTGLLYGPKPRRQWSAVEKTRARLASCHTRMTMEIPTQQSEVQIITDASGDRLLSSCEEHVNPCSQPRFSCWIRHGTSRVHDDVDSRGSRSHGAWTCERRPLDGEDVDWHIENALTSLLLTIVSIYKSHRNQRLDGRLEMIEANGQ